MPLKRTFHYHQLLSLSARVTMELTEVKRRVWYCAVWWSSRRNLQSLWSLISVCVVHTVCHVRLSVWQWQSILSVCAVDRCMDGSSTRMRCRRCNAAWAGTTLLIGTMYSYDVFAATPCCDARLRCKQCHESVFEHGSTRGSTAPPTGAALTLPLKYFSEYSRRVKCQRCGVDDFHFVKPLDEMYNMSSVRPTSQPQQQRTSAALPRIWSDPLHCLASDCLWQTQTLSQGSHWPGKSGLLRRSGTGLGILLVVREK